MQLIVIKRKKEREGMRKTDKETENETNENDLSS